MCWCQPDVRTPCCGTARCHEAAARVYHQDTLSGYPPSLRRGLPPGQECRWCVRKIARPSQPPPPETRTCPTCGGAGKLPAEPTTAPGTASGSARYG